MEKVLAVAIGGAAGAVLRYITFLYFDKGHDHYFPWATLFINLVGSFLIGFLWGLFDKIYVSPGIRLFIFVGLLGSFTTFSTFAFEVFNISRNGSVLQGLIYMIGTNIIGISLAAGGYYLSKLI
ncbi:MAG: fluoride efflux transporter CrcB [Bacteroidetes bacterium CG18_big_fil_WC_8_21_14_2_50_41_14]|nr:MAG: fluoride efflux transporter CrcB [Bacteroidetes bacterium CG18_big_fil_WC_8_21_14_2_50_41_14]PJB55121.1 MAG: fluoride efflux transporter CrcB [Bacteroidetes bacterium CG_4_9_14_3_um_filter_41_19]